MSTSQQKYIERPKDARLLIADDCPDFVAMLRAFLRRDRLAIDWAQDGHLAVEMAHERAYSIILLDLQMPKLDGCGVASRLRADGYAGPLICVTAHAMVKHLHAALAAGCDLVITKPVSLHALRDAILSRLSPAASVGVAP